MTENQIVECQNCGSKWCLNGLKGQVIRELVECPLCAKEKNKET